MKPIKEYMVPAKLEPINEGILLFLAALFAGSLLMRIGIKTIKGIGNGIVSFWDWTFDNR